MSNALGDRDENFIFEFPSYVSIDIVYIQLIIIYFCHGKANNVILKNAVYFGWSRLRNVSREYHNGGGMF